MSTFNNNHCGKSQDALRQERHASHGKSTKKSQVKQTTGSKINRSHDRNK